MRAGKLLLQWVLLLQCVSIAIGETLKKYEGTQILRIKVPDVQMLGSLDDLFNASENQQVLKKCTINSTVDVLIERHKMQQLARDLARHQLDYEVLVEDVARKMKEEQTSMKDYKRRKRKSVSGSHVVGNFARYEEICQWMEALAQSHPELVTVHSIGQTYEGRDIRVLQLGVPRMRKWKMWIDGGIHAREWIAPSTVIYIADRLVRGYESKTPEVMLLLESLDWYLLPVVNPDGYEYTHTKDRMWRKNRQPSGSGCHGVDLNRNWRFEWGGPSSSENPCSSFFRGFEPESELEVRHIADFMLPRAEAFIGYVTYHSYGQRFLTRWDYTTHAVPQDHSELMSLAVKAVRAIYHTNGVRYSVGRASELMYPYGGGSPDWSKAVAKIKYPYLVELRDHSSFILPRHEIVPTGEENWAAIRTIAQEIVREHNGILAPATYDYLLDRAQGDVKGYKAEFGYNDTLSVVLASSSSRTIRKTDIYLHLASIVSVFFCFPEISPRISFL